MSLDRLKNQLIQAARDTQQNDDSVPYGFEMKVMREISAITAPGSVTRNFAKGLWTACGPAIAVMVIAFFVIQPQSSSDLSADLALEQAVMAPLMNESEIW